MNATGRPAVVTVGSINIDLVVKAARRPQAGETFPGESFAIYVGGKGANQAVQAALSGATSYMVARMGDDVFAPLVAEMFDRTGVDRTFVTADPMGSGVGHVVIDAQGDYSTVIVARANGNLAPGDIDRAERAFAASQMLLLQLETPLPTVVYAAGKARSLGLRVCLNAAPALAVPAELLAAVDLLIVNTIEAQMLLGSNQPLTDLASVQAAAVALANAQRDVVITLGAKGAVALERHGQFHVQPGYSIEVVNTIGAGDAFVGELAARMAEGAPVDQALRYANAAGALAVTRHEPQGRTPERAEIAALLASHSGQSSQSTREV